MKRLSKNRGGSKANSSENHVSNQIIRGRSQRSISGSFLNVPFFITIVIVFFFSALSGLSAGILSEKNLLQNSPIERGQNRLSGLFFQREMFGFDHSFYVPKGQHRLRTWVHGFGNWTNLGASAGLTNLEYTSYGVSVGIDRQIGRNFLFGISFGGNQGSIKAKNGMNYRDSDISAGHTALYCRMALQNIFFDIEGGLGYNDQSFPSQTALQWNVNGEAGTWWTQGLGKVEPYLGLRYVSLEQDPEAESKTALLIGVRYSWKTTGTYSVTSPRIYTGILQELGSRNLMNIATFTDAPTVFSIPDYETAKTRCFVGGGFTSSMGTSLDMYLRYTAELASDYSSHTLLLGMNWNY